MAGIFIAATFLKVSTLHIDVCFELFFSRELLKSDKLMLLLLQNLVVLPLQLGICPMELEAFLSSCCFSCLSDVVEELNFGLDDFLSLFDGNVLELYVRGGRGGGTVSVVRIGFLVGKSWPLSVQVLLVPTSKACCLLVLIISLLVLMAILVARLGNDVLDTSKQF